MSIHDSLCNRCRARIPHEMIIAITGDRHDLPVYKEMIRKACRDMPPTTRIVIGDCKTGVDAIAREIVEREFHFPVKVFVADWKRYGRRAGPMRNSDILDAQPEIVYAFHVDINASRGTKNMISQARARGIPVIVVNA